MSPAEHLSAVAENARALAARGDVRAARTLLQQAVDTSPLRADHPEVLAAIRLLSWLNREVGDLSDARRLLEEALANAYHTLGEDHPVLLGMAYDLATLADELGNRHEARRNFGRLVRYGPDVFGPEHEYVRAARAYLDGQAAASPPSTPPPALPSVAVERPAGPPVPPVPPPPVPPEPVAPPHPHVQTTHTLSVDEPPSAPSRPVHPAPPPLRETAPPVPVSPAEPVSPPGPIWRPEPAPPTPTPPTPVPLPAVPLPAAPPQVGPPPAGPRHSRRAPGRAPGRARIPLIALAVIATIALVAGAAAAVVSFNRARPQGTRPAPSATTAAPLLPPGDLRLRDDGTAITLTWTDPSGGTVPFLVAGGRADKVPSPLQSVPSGQTSYTLNGLNPAVDYCFLVAAVYSADHPVPSNLVCTQRAKPSASASR